MKFTTNKLRTNPEGDVLFEFGAKRYAAIGAISVYDAFNSVAEPSVAPPTDISLVTVVAADSDSPLSRSWLQSRLDTLENYDEYKRHEFLNGLIVVDSRTGRGLTPDCLRYLLESGNEWVAIKTRADGEVLDQGSYLYTDKTLKPVCRLYDDRQRAFLATLEPKLDRSDSTAFRQLGSSGRLYDCLAVAVPSRVPALGRSTLPRLRVVVKDVFYLKGLKTSLCNLAYYDLADPAPYTAKVVMALINDGAHILGLTKLSSMVAREEPMDAVDFHTAFNPRGDGYQSPAGSSSGSAVCVAAYDWVDCAIGTDTSGSGRRPALVNGVWQYRPSHDLIDIDGMITTYPAFDTPCIFSRSLSILRRVAELWIPPGPSHSPPETQHGGYEVIYPLDYLPIGNPEQMELIDRFVGDMRVILSAKVTEFSIRAAWKTNHPPGTLEDVDQYLQGVITRTYYYEFYHSTDKFRHIYATRHGGRPPYVIPFVRRRWTKGAAVSAAEHEEATERLNVYKTWLLDTLFLSRKRTALVILPISKVQPNYRDTLSPSPEEQSALDEMFLSPILAAPDIAIPIGEITYDSRITEQEELLPVVVNVVGAPKSDRELFKVVEEVMERSNRPMEVEVGSSMFPSAKLHE